MKLIERLKTISGDIFKSKMSSSNNRLKSTKKYKLMLKQHVETGISYLCVTTKDDYVGYSGSGTRWKRLLKKHPSIIFTSLLFESDDEIEFNNKCSYYSELFDIVENPYFANLILETGFDKSKICGFSNLSKDDIIKFTTKAGIVSSKSGKGIFHPEYDRSEANRNQWKNLDEETYLNRVELNKKNSAIGGQISKDLGLNFSTWDEETRKEVASKGGKTCGKIPMWTNGVSNKRSFECPGEGWRRGMLSTNRYTKQKMINYYDVKETIYV